jgi:hypothetical protein
LDNPVFSANSDIPVDPTGGNRFLSYLPLFPLFISLFIFPGLGILIPIQAFLAIALVNVTVIALSAWVLYRIATMRGRQLGWLGAIAICASLFLIMRASWSFGGRPEVLVRLFFTIGMVLVMHMRRPLSLACALGVLVGLTAAAHVVAPFMLFSCVGLIFLIHENVRKTLEHLTVSAISAIISFLGVMQWSPFGLLETLRGVLWHGARMLKGINPSGALLSLAQRPYVMLYVLIAAFLVFVAGRSLMRMMRERGPGWSVLFSALAAIPVGYVLFAAINARTYYISPFLLIILAAFVYYVLHGEGSRRIRQICVVLFVILVGISLKHVMLFPSFLTDGMRLPEARTAFADVIAQHAQAMLVLKGSHLWTLSEEYEAMLPGEPVPRSGITSYLMFAGEVETPEAPQVVGSCELVKSFYRSHSPSMFGITLARTTPGYQFAAYDCSGGRSVIQ